MQANRCGMPDINLDDAGNLDENSLQLIESVIGKGTKVTTVTLTTSVTNNYKSNPGNHKYNSNNSEHLPR